MPEPSDDSLSESARTILRRGSSRSQALIVPVQPRPGLDEDDLTTLFASELIAGKVVDSNAQQCVKAALWLLHDQLDEAHQIVQRIDTNVGSYWHGVIHRREGDFANAKYWFARSGDLSIRQTLTLRADDILRGLPADKLLFRITANGWNPAAFVDLVSSVSNQPEDSRCTIAASIQLVEWQVLFEFCVRTAVGR